MKLTSERVTLLLAIAFVLTVFISESMAQTTNGRLVITAKDQSQALVGGASVSVINEGTGQELTGSTNESGVVVFPQLTVGTYKVTVEAAGFKTSVADGVKIDVGQEYGLSVTLEVGGGSDVVTVSAGEELLQTTNAEVKNTVSEKQVQDLPLNGRNPLQLIQLQAGVAGGANSARPNVTTTINGQRASTASVTLDGINIQDNLFRENSIDFSPLRPTVAQVAEFSVTAQNAAADVGGGASAVRAVTPSGTNEFHGSVFEFHRNSAQSANDFFNNLQGVDRPNLIRNQFGFTLSGPIIKNRLFFFGFYEGFRQRTSSPFTGTILLPQARQGIFTYRDNSGQVRTLDILRLKGVAIDPFISGVLAQAPQNANATTVGDGLNTSGFALNQPFNQDRNPGGVRIDYQLNMRHRLGGVYNYADENVQRPDADTSFGLPVGVVNTASTHFGVGYWIWNVNDALVNEVRIGGNRSEPLFDSKADTSGIQLVYPLITDPVNQFLDQGRTTSLFSIQDNVSYSRGNHFLRFGFQYDRIRTTPFVFNNGSVPTFTLGFGVGAPSTAALQARDFPGGIDVTQLQTANNLLALLGGIVSAGTVAYEVTSRDSGFQSRIPERRQFEVTTWSGYVTDSWRVNPRLTINLGLRYDYQTPLKERNNLALTPVFNGRSAREVVTDPNGIYDFVNGFYNSPDRNNFAPNVSVAWDIPGLGRQTVLRAGYSLAYVNDQAIAAPRNALSGNDGLSAAVTRNNLFGTVSGSVPGLINTVFAAPQFKVPRTFAENFDLDPTSAAFAVDNKFKTPYFQQWNVSLEREVFSNTTAIVRYVGNRSTTLARGIDFNQVDVISNGFAEDVLRAQRNGFLALAATGTFDPRFNANIPGSQQLTVFPLLTAGGLLTNRGVIQPLIQRGEAGQLAAIYFQNGLAGSVNFVANPNTFVADVLGNFSESNYHALQIELNRRFSNGLALQANYSFSKNLSNSPGTSTQVLFEPLLDNNQPSLEYSRSQLDIPHIFKLNGIYELPFGQGKRFSSDNRIVRKLVGGWSVTSIITYQTGNPFTIFSGRGTLNRTARSINNTADSSLTLDQIKDLLGVRKTPNGIFFIDPKVIGVDGRAVNPDGQAPFAGQVFFNPGAGRVGSLARLSLNAPNFINWDFGFIKRTPITERVVTEFRTEFFNFTNTPVFAFSDQNINSPTFGRITQQLNSPRIVQFAFKIVF